MQLKSFKSNAWKSRLWKIKGIINAAVFAYKHPRHVQVSIENTQVDEFELKANYAGINEEGFLRVIEELVRESYNMQAIQQEYKNMLK